jgi:FkbM family methyltransferase
MFGIRFIEKSNEAPCGKVLGLVFEEVSWLYGDDELPFKFEIFRDGECIWTTDLYANMWASWDTLDNDNFTAVIKNKQDEIISQFKYDVWVNRNATEQFFDTWINKNPNSNGIVIGTHDGTNGGWVKHIKNKLTRVVLVEASEKQFNELVQNYSDFDNVSFRNNVITGNGGNVKFYEFGEGNTNTLSESHYKNHIKDDEELTIVDMVSLGINDLIIEENLQHNLDWLHLDTESIDDEIIMSLDFNKINKPKLIVFETINFSEERLGNSERIDKLFDWLRSNGYKVKYDYWNSFAFLH